MRSAPASTANHADADADRKAFESLRAACALRGYTLARSNPDDGPVTYWASRWGLIRELRTLADVDAFVRMIAGPAAIDESVAANAEPVGVR